MTPESTIFGLLICCAVEGFVIWCLEHTNDRLRKQIRELNHENSRLEIDNCKLVASLTTAKRLLAARKKGA